MKEYESADDCTKEQIIKLLPKPSDALALMVKVIEKEYLNDNGPIEMEMNDYLNIKEDFDADCHIVLC